MERWIKIVLWILDLFSYVSAAYQIVIKKDYELGAVLTIVSLLLHAFPYVSAHEIKIKQSFIAYFKINELHEGGKKYFVYFSIAYVIINIILLVIGTTSNKIEIIYFNFWGLPVIYSLFILVLRWIYGEGVCKFIEAYYYITPAPYITFFIVTLFVELAFGWIILFGVVLFLMYLPVLGICKLVDIICTPKKSSP